MNAYAALKLAALILVVVILALFLAGEIDASLSVG